MASGRLNVAGKRVGLTMAQTRMWYLAVQYIEFSKGKAPLLAPGFDIVISDRLMVVAAARKEI
jgi:hypothetical protein